MFLILTSRNRMINAFMIFNIIPTCKGIVHRISQRLFYKLNAASDREIKENFFPKKNIKEHL